MIQNDFNAIGDFIALLDFNEFLHVSVDFNVGLDEFFHDFVHIANKDFLLNRVQENQDKHD